MAPTAAPAASDVRLLAKDLVPKFVGRGAPVLAFSWGAGFLVVCCVVEELATGATEQSFGMWRVLDLLSRPRDVGSAAVMMSCGS